MKIYYLHSNDLKLHNVLKFVNNNNNFNFVEYNVFYEALDIYNKL